MSWSSTEPKSSWPGAAWNVGVALAALLIVAVLVWAMKHYTTPPALNAERAALRVQNLAELRAVDAEAMETYGWIDPAKGIVRLPVDRALELTAAAWQNPAAARADLIDRVETATFVPPPPPEEPGEFE